MKISGFTLIELSITLIIIGLIVGGILVGQDLISAAKVRAQISQIEQYKAAVNTFKVKYGYIPGDIPTTVASAYGLTTAVSSHGVTTAPGNGNDILSNGTKGIFTVMGAERNYFWIHLKDALLIDNKAINYMDDNIDDTDVGKYLPQAKIGGTNYIMVFNASSAASGYGLINYYNYFGINSYTTVKGYNKGGGYACNPSAGVNTASAYNIDAKIDDGLPQSGNIIAALFNNHPGIAWSDGGYLPSKTTTAKSPSTTSCYDNGGIANAAQKYTLNNGGNCSLMIKF